MHSTVQIVGFLRALIDHSAFVTVRFGDGELIASMLLGVDAERGVVLLDCSGDRAANDRLLRASGLLVSANLDHVAIHFTAPAARSVMFEHAPALEVPLPPVLARLQRREFYRVPVVGRTLYCEIPAVDGDRQVQYGPPARARVTNLSCGGMRLSDHAGIGRWRAGMFLPACRVALPEDDLVGLDLQIVHVTPNMGRRGARAGVRFLSLDNAMRMRLQRYITDLERQRLVTA